MDAGFLEFNLSLNVKVPHPGSLTNIPQDISKIDAICKKLMAYNDILLNYKQELCNIHYHQNEVGHPVINLMEANKRFEEDFNKMKHAVAKEPNENLGWNVSTAMGAQSLPNQAIFPSNQTAENTQTLDILVEHEPTKEVEKGSDNHLLNPAKRKRFRRNWTKQLNHLFLDVVKYLGGAQAATPKSIVQYMDVEGLTVEQVRSHLQVHRRKLKNIALMEGRREYTESVGACENDTHLDFNGHESVRIAEPYNDMDDCFSKNGVNECPNEFRLPLPQIPLNHTPFLLPVDNAAGNPSPPPETPLCSLFFFNVLNQICSKTSPLFHSCSFSPSIVCCCRLRNSQGEEARILPQSGREIQNVSFQIEVSL